MAKKKEAKKDIEKKKGGKGAENRKSSRPSGFVSIFLLIMAFFVFSYLMGDLATNIPSALWIRDNWSAAISYFLGVFFLLLVIYETLYFIAGVFLRSLKKARLKN